MTITCYLQVGFCFQYHLTNLVWVSIDFFSFSWSQTHPQRCFKNLKTSFWPSPYNKKMCWGQDELKLHYLLFRVFIFLCLQLSKNTFFICTSWKRKQTMEQQSHRACEWTKSKQKKVTSHLNLLRAVLFDLPHKQCNSIIKGRLHCLTSESKGRYRYLVNNILLA